MAKRNDVAPNLAKQSRQRVGIWKVAKRQDQSQLRPRSLCMVVGILSESNRPSYVFDGPASVSSLPELHSEHQLAPRLESKRDAGLSEDGTRDSGRFSSCASALQQLCQNCTDTIRTSFSMMGRD